MIAGTNKTQDKQSSSTATQNTAAVDYIAGRLYLLSVVNFLGTGGEIVTGTIGGGTWTEVVSREAGGRRATVFRYLPASDNLAEITTLDSEGGVHEWGWSIDEFTGVPTTGTNGADAIGDTDTATGTGAATKICGTLTGIVAGDASFGCMATDSPGYAWNPESGYVELADQQAANISINVEWDDGGDTTPAFTENGANTDWTMVGVCLRLIAAVEVEDPFVPYAMVI